MNKCKIVKAEYENVRENVHNNIRLCIVSTQYFAEVKSDLMLLNVRNREVLTNQSQAINVTLIIVNRFNINIYKILFWLLICLKLKHFRQIFKFFSHLLY